MDAQVPPPYGTPQFGPGYGLAVPYGAPYGAPQYGPPYGPPPPSIARRNVRSLGTALMVLLGIASASLVAVAAIAAWRYSMLSSFLDGGLDAVNVAEVDTSDTLIQIGLVATALSCAASAVLTICWLFAARTNAETYTSMPFNLGRGWTIGGWFIPVGALFMPLRSALEVHRGTVAGLGPGNTKPSGGAITGVWWGLWLAGTIGVQIGIRSVGSADASDSIARLTYIRDFSAAIIPGLLLLAAAGIALILFVKKISAIQTVRNTQPPMGYGYPEHQYQYQYPTAPPYGYGHGA